VRTSISSRRNFRLKEKRVCIRPVAGVPDCPFMKMRSAVRVTRKKNSDNRAVSVKRMPTLKQVETIIHAHRRAISSNASKRIFLPGEINYLTRSLIVK
jgi:hypothetical protein